jgi:hypothetical protein
MADNRFNPTIIEEGLGAVSIAACIMASPVFRPWYRKWGATEAEVKMSLPGDDLVPHPKLETTRAITIQAPAAEIWPWLVQLGQGRGGLYSYEWLENLIGCDMRNADRILPEHQDLKVGDKVRLGPEGYPYFDVAGIEPGRTLILCGDMPSEQTITTTWIWLFYLTPLDEKSTRLIIRSRLVYEPTLGNFLSWRVFTDPISFVMERKTLQGIKVRAEAAAAN